METPISNKTIKPIEAPIKIRIKDYDVTDLKITPADLFKIKSEKPITNGQMEYFEDLFI